jgi:polysaccharide export outer membrane protein
MSEPRSSGGSAQMVRSTGLPEFVVPESGQISIPFAGLVRVNGRSLREIEREIERLLAGKAHLPQILVRLVRNATATVTVVGDVSNSLRMPLTPKGERILDALAAAGGTRQAVEKVTLQVARRDRVISMPLKAVIEDTRQNVILERGDVITALYQPFSFTALGASGKNAEIPFEATGVTLSQALGRLGGLQDMRADPKGVFVFRWVKPEAVDPGTSPVRNRNGEFAVIYTLNMKDPASYFAMQNFVMQDKDVIYIANSSVAEIQRFTSIIAATVLPVISVGNSF